MKNATFTKLENGKWGVAIPGQELELDPDYLKRQPSFNAGEIISVEKKDGTKSQVVLGKYIDYKYGKGIFEIQSSRLPRFVKDGPNWKVFVPSEVKILKYKDGKEGVFVARKDGSVNLVFLAPISWEAEGGRIWLISSDQGSIFD
jgi:hypothetical protein